MNMRLSTEACGTCQHYKRPDGECKRYPPSVLWVGHDTEKGPLFLTIYPRPMEGEHDRCGEYSRDIRLGVNL